MPCKEKNTVRGYIAELGGELAASFLFTSIATMGTIASKDNMLSVALVNGATEMAILHIFGYLLGAHKNPLITAIGFVHGHIQCEMMFLKFFASGIGHMLGYGIVGFIYPNSMDIAYEMMHSMPRIISMHDAFFTEMLFTFILIFSWCAIWDKRAKKNVGTSIIRLGMVKSGLTFMAAKFTGASFNPLKSLAIAAYHSNFEYLSYFVLAQFFGTVIAYLLWKNFMKPPLTLFPRCPPNNDLVSRRQHRIVYHVLDHN